MTEQRASCCGGQVAHCPGQASRSSAILTCSSVSPSHLPRNKSKSAIDAYSSACLGWVSGGSEVWYATYFDCDAWTLNAIVVLPIFCSITCPSLFFPPSSRDAQRTKGASAENQFKSKGKKKKEEKEKEKENKANTLNTFHPQVSSRVCSPTGTNLRTFPLTPKKHGNTTA